MTSKEIVQDVLRRMPEDASLHDIAQELEFIAAVQEGMSELDEYKDSISIEKVEQKVPAWTVTIGRRRRGRHKQTQLRTTRTRVKRKAGDSLETPAQ